MYSSKSGATARILGSSKLLRADNYRMKCGMTEEDLEDAISGRSPHASPCSFYVIDSAEEGVTPDRVLPPGSTSVKSF